jgi:hypothetical protein
LDTNGGPFDESHDCRKWPVTLTDGVSKCYKNKRKGEETTGYRQIGDHSLVPNEHGYVTALEPEQREVMMGFDEKHTKPIHKPANAKLRNKFLGQAFHVETTRMFLDPLKGDEDDKFVVICPFAGVGGDLVALEKMSTPVKVVITMEQELQKRNILEAFLDKKRKDKSSSFYGAKHYNWGDLCQHRAIWLDEKGWAKIVKELKITRGNVLLTGGPPCDNLPGTSNQGANNELRGQSGLGGLSTGLCFLFALMAVMLLSAVQAIQREEEEDDDNREVDWESGLFQVDDPNSTDIVLYEDGEDSEQEKAGSKASDAKEKSKRRHVEVIVDARKRVEDQIAIKLDVEGFCVGCSCEDGKGLASSGGKSAKCRFDANRNSHMKCRFKSDLAAKATMV